MSKGPGYGHETKGRGRVRGRRSQAGAGLVEGVVDVSASMPRNGECGDEPLAPVRLVLSDRERVRRGERNARGYCVCELAPCDSVRRGDV